MERKKPGISEIMRFLTKYQKTRRRIAVLQSELYQIRDLTEQITVDPTREKIQSSGSKDRLGDTVAKMVDKEVEIMAEITLAFGALNAIEDAINHIEDPDEQYVLQLRYIEGLDWQETAKKMNVHERTAQRIEDKAKMSLFVVLESVIIQNEKE